MKLCKCFTPYHQGNSPLYPGLLPTLKQVLMFPTVCLCFLLFGCHNQPDQIEKPNPSPNDRHFLNRVVSPESQLIVEAFCGHCHKMPKPENFPVDAWKKEVERGFDFYTQSGRTDLVRPNVYDAIAYFTQKAPARNEFIASSGKTAAHRKLDPGFELIHYDSKRFSSATANIVFAKENKSFVHCDMLNGQVYLQPFNNLNLVTSIFKTRSPVNSTICDLDNDGKFDILVSDIGDYRATDSTQGKIVCLKQNESGFQPIEIASELGRICQTVVEDFDADGDQDILVAEFGYFQTGSIFLLRRDADAIGRESFSRIEMDPRHGTVRIQVVDIDNDGDVDFVAAIAQEFETVDVFLNDGSGDFSRQSIFAAEFPSYGISGIEMVDLDKDGDQDILLTNGDTFDSMLPKKYHSIQWLENLGNLRFRRNEIKKMPGVHCARSADFDNDGDMDIVACAFMSNQDHDLELDAIIFLENNGHQLFEKLWIEKSKLHYPNLTIGDFDDDDRTDFAVSNAVLGDKSIQEMPVKIYLNRLKQGKSTDGKVRR